MESNIAIITNKLFVVTMVVEDGSDNTWYVDTKAVQHMSHDKKCFMTYDKWDKGQLVVLGDNTTQQVSQGHMFIKLNNGQLKENVLHVLGF